MKNKEIVRITFIADEDVFEESSAQNEFDDILLKPLKDAGYKLSLISAGRNAELHPLFTYEIKKPNQQNK